MVCLARIKLTTCQKNNIDTLNNLFLIKDEKDNPLYVANVLTDISEEKRLQEHIVRERNKAQQYLDMAGSLIIALDAKGMVTLINREGCELLEASEEEIVGKNWFDQ